MPDIASPAPLLLQAAESLAPPLVIQMPDGRELRYQLVNPSVEQLLGARAQYEALSDADRAGDVRAWVGVLATFMGRDEATRFVREQGIATLRNAVTLLLDHVRTQIEGAKPKPAS